MANYYILLTDYGKQVIANAHTAASIQLVDVVLGDANNQPYLPESRLGQTALVHETARVPITRVQVVGSTTAEVTALVPSNIGGFNIHEIGIVDVTGNLVYVGNFHGGYRPLLTEGAGGDMEIVFSITANNLAQVLIEVDPTIVTASKAWVNSTITKQFTDFQALFNSWQEAVNQDLELVKSRKIEPVSIGGLLITTKNYANSQEVHDGEGYGVWTRFGQGKVLAGYSTIANDDARFKTIGNVFEIGSEIENQKAIVAQFWKRLPNDYVAPTFDIYYTSDVEGLNRVSQINEDSAIYLWIDVTNATTPIRVSNFSKQGAGGFISDAANFTYPTTINNGKNLMISVLPENYHVDMQTIIDWGFTLTDNMVDTETDIHSALTINDTISDAPPPPPEPTGRMVFNVYKTGEISDGGTLYKDTIRIDCIKNVDNVSFTGPGYTAGGVTIDIDYHTFPSSITDRYSQVIVTQPSIYDNDTTKSVPYFHVTNQSGYAFTIQYLMGNSAQWHTASQSIPIDDSKPFKQIIIDYPAP